MSKRKKQEQKANEAVWSAITKRKVEARPFRKWVVTFDEDVSTPVEYLDTFVGATLIGQSVRTIDADRHLLTVDATVCVSPEQDTERNRHRLKWAVLKAIKDFQREIESEAESSTEEPAQ